MSAPRQIALVTGASSGIGESIALRLLSEGWTVYGAARRTDRMVGLVAQGGKALALDVTDDASMRAAVQQILDAEGRIDALVNNAGYGSYGALEEVPVDEARRQFEVNVFGLMRLTQLVLPAMRAQRSGTIVNISSVGGEIWMPVGGWYHATKHALEVLSDVLRLEVEEFGVRVAIVQPGGIRSEWAGIAADTLEASSQGTVYGRWVAPVLRGLRGADGFSPSWVARAVSHAVHARRPRRRYATPIDAKIGRWFVRWLPVAFWEGALRLAARLLRP
ncbi:MAG: SDR family NAD(P)-dependent oxidoreductase [Alphaproteobacteria bacterium]|nr:SDR family NAD(P)-dependent oxidoreductase [Alphaproteobacteria bacterium]